jgi:hypothetical protein
MVRAFESRAFICVHVVPVHARHLCAACEHVSLVRAACCVLAGIEPGAQEYLRARLAREGLGGSATVVAASEAAGLVLPQPADLVLFVNVFHHVDAAARVGYLRAAAAAPAGGGCGAIVRGGHVVIVEARVMELPVKGPPMWMRVAPEKIREEATAAGLEFVSAPDFLPYDTISVFRVPL